MHRQQMATTPTANPPLARPQHVLVLHGPSGRKELSSAWQVGRGALGLAQDNRISRKHLGFYVEQNSSGWAVEQLSANASWIRSAGADFELELERGSTHRLKHGDTLCLVVQGDEMYTLRIELLEHTVPQQHDLPITPVTSSSMQAMDNTIVASVANPLAHGASLTEGPNAAVPPRQPAFDNRMAEQPLPRTGDALIDDMVIAEVAPIDDGDIRFGEIFFEETRQVRPYLYVPKGVPLEQVLPAIIACFQLKQPTSILDVLPYRGAHDHYLQWSLDVLRDERARNTWRWRDESETQAGQDNDEPYRQQCMRQFGTQLVASVAEIVKATDAAGAWFCSKAGRDASQQLLGHALEEANSTDYVWLGVACASRLCWSRQLRKCSRALNKRDGVGIKPDVKRRVRYPTMRSVFLDNATKFDRDLELSIGQQDPSMASRTQLQWSLLDPHISHLVVFEDPCVEDALRSWATSNGLSVDDDSQDQSQLHLSQPVDRPGLDSRRGADDTSAGQFSLTPTSFLRASTGEPSVFLDYWRHVNPSERNFWRHLRETMQKLDVQVGCLLTNSDEVAWATECAKLDLPVVALEASGAISIEQGIEGADAAAAIQAQVAQQELESDEDTTDVWTPRKKQGLSQRVAQFRNLALGVAFSKDVERPSQPKAEAVAEPEPEPEAVAEPEPESEPTFHFADTRRRHMPPSTQDIAIKRGPTGFGFAVSDSCVVTHVAGAAAEARVPLNSRIVGVAGQRVSSKSDVIAQLRLLGPDVSSIKFTFQMLQDDNQRSEAAFAHLPPDRPLVTAGNRPQPNTGPHVMARLVRVPVSDPIMYTSLAQRKQLKAVLQTDDRHDRKDDKKQRASDKRVVLAAWRAYTTLRYNACVCKIRDDRLQTTSQLMHVIVTLIACITIVLEIDLEGLEPVSAADIEAGTLSAWVPKNSMSGDMDSFWATWAAHTLNFVSPCVLIAILGLQAIWSDDVQWAGYLLRAERLRSAIFSYRGRVGEWSLPITPRGGWWYEQLARVSPCGDNAAMADDLRSTGVRTREQNRAKLNQLQQDTLAASMTRASNTATQATVPTVIQCGVVLGVFGSVLLIAGLYVEFQYDDRPLALLLSICSLAAMTTSAIIVQPLANQSHEGKSLDMTPLKEPTRAFEQTCSPPFEFELPWNKDVGINLEAGSTPSAVDVAAENDGDSDESQKPADIQATTVVAIDNGFDPISADKYLQFRVYPLRAELGQLVPQLTTRLRQIQRLLFLSSLASAVCAIAAPVFQRHLAIWVCIFNTIGCGALFYSNRTSAKEVACAAHTTCVALDACIDWWLALRAQEKLRRENFERLVSDVERAVNVLCVVWTAFELELPNPRGNNNNASDGTTPQLRSHDRDLDANLRQKIQARAGKLML